MKSHPYVKKIKKIKGIEDILEDDIRYSTMYLLDSGVTPCRWHEAKIDEIEHPESVDITKAYRLSGFPTITDRIDYPPLRILVLSMTCYSPIGTADPDSNPVVILSVATNKGLSARFIAKEDHSGLDDSTIIEGFNNFVKDFFPCERRVWK